jgi:hypothetical protein
VLFPYAALVVLLSVVVHGGSLMLIARRLGGRTAGGQDDRTTQQSGLVPVMNPVADDERISFGELERLRETGAPVRLLDVRADRGWFGADLMAAGAVRVDPDAPAESAARLALPRHDWLVAYCA